MGGLTAMHSRVGLCPGDHRDEFFMPDPGPNEKCPSCDEVLIQFVAAADLDKALAALREAERRFKRITMFGPYQSAQMRCEAEDALKALDGLREPV